jgi:hypothetical protein
MFNDQMQHFTAIVKIYQESRLKYAPYQWHVKWDATPGCGFL